MALNDHQLAVVRAVHTGRDSLVVEAAPGAGKSTTLRASVDGYHGYALVTAFSNSVVKEHEPFCREHAEVRTTHAIGRGMLVDAFPRMRREVDARKAERHLFEALKAVDVVVSPRMRANLHQVVKIAKMQLASSEARIIELLRDSGPWTVGLTLPEVAKLVGDVMQRCGTDESCFDFDDMLWMPFVRGLIRPGSQPIYDAVFCDELQDLSVAQAAIVLNLGHRFYGYGDGNQRLYNWAGAEREIGMKIGHRQRAVTMRLPLTYRCSKAVVAEAQTLFPDIEALPDAPEGEIFYGSIEDLARTLLKPRDFVLARTNHDALSVYTQLIDRGSQTPVYIEGAAFRGLLEGLAEEAAERKTTPAAVAQSQGSGVSVVRAIELLWARGQGRADGYMDEIRNAFTPKEGGAVVLTAHQAKGRGADGVHIIRSSFMASRWRDGEDADRILYTAITRAKTRLSYIEVETEKPLGEEVEV